MGARHKTEPPVRLANREELNRLMDEVEQRMGFVPDPTATIEKLREMLRAEGVRTEDNALTRELLELFAFNLPQPIPEVPVPLREGEAPVLLPLGRLPNEVYDRARYARRV